MQIKEMAHPVTSKRLNESFAKTFGYKLKLDEFSDCQLEDARNKLRTNLSQLEMTESYTDILESSTYQKTRALLDVINQSICEREEAAELAEHAVNNRKVSENAICAAMRHRAENMAVPESWIQNAIKRIKLGESDRDELSAELTLRYDLNEAQASWVLLEGEEQKAENILATKDMVSKITNWIEDTAAMKADQLLELLDSIRVEQGSEVSQRFNQTVQPVLESLYSALVATREGLTQGLAVVSGEQVETMGGEMPAPDAGTEMAPELGAGPTAGEIPAPEGEMPPAIEAGRIKRESTDYSGRLGKLLGVKKK